MNLAASECIWSCSAAVNILADPLMSWSTLRVYAILYICYKYFCWLSCDSCVSSVCMWSGHFVSNISSQPFVAFICFQDVCHIIILLQACQLPLSPWSALRMYAIWSFCYKYTFWPSHGLGLLSGCMWSTTLVASTLPSDPLISMVCPRMYVICSIFCKHTSWPYCDLVYLQVVCDPVLSLLTFVQIIFQWTLLLACK